MLPFQKTRKQQINSKKVIESTTRLMKYNN